MKPRRIQLSRRKGWRMPPNTVVVARPSKWGNPFAVKRVHGQWTVNGPHIGIWKESEIEARAAAVQLYRAYLENDGTHPGTVRDEGGAFLKVLAREELRSKNLACWCGEGPCHADVLLEIANATGGAA